MILEVPVLEKITADIVTTLEGITKATGYSVNAVVTRPGKELAGKSQDDKADVKYVVCRDVWRYLDGTTGANSDDFQNAHVTSGHDCYVQTYRIEIFVIDSEQSDDEIDTKLTIATCEAKKALMLDVNRGGFANDTRPLGGESPDFTVGACAQVLFVDVIYTTIMDKPFEY